MAPPPCIGIDLGAAKTMVVGETGEIVRNELGGHSSASLVGFSGDERYVGEGAVAQLATNAKKHGERSASAFTAEVRVASRRSTPAPRRPLLMTL